MNKDWSIVLGAHEGYTIVDTGEIDGHVEVYGDNQAEIAKLVKAAPQLLEACQVALEYLAGQNHPRTATEQIAFKDHQRLILRAAIQAATE